MSIFWKLFPGAPKGDEDATLSNAPTGVAGEEGPVMKRPPNEGRTQAAGAKPEAPPKPGPTPNAAGQTGEPKPTEPNAPPPSGPIPTGGAARAMPARVPTQPLMSRVNIPAAVAPRPPGATPGPPPVQGAGLPSAAPMPTGPAARTPTAATTMTRPLDLSGAVASIARPAGPGVPAPVAAPRADAAKGVSAEPAAPEAPKTGRGPISIADTFERLLGSEVDAQFASIQTPLPPALTPPPEINPSDFAEVRALFAQLAAYHVRPVRDFVIDLRWNDATVDWLPICEPALQSLRRAAHTLELTELCAALDRFAEALVAAQEGESRTISGATRDALLARYEELSREMPQAFALDLDRTQREGVILQSLLLQVPGVNKITLDKMVAAGLSTLEALGLATATDIAATTGMPEGLAERIVLRFRQYRENVKATVPDATRFRERERVTELVTRLRTEHEAYERAAEGWSRAAGEQKKELRKAREKTLLAIHVELARLGEVERLARLERLPFEGKLTQLESFLQDAWESYAGPP